MSETNQLKSSKETIDFEKFINKHYFLWMKNFSLSRIMLPERNQGIIMIVHDAIVPSVVSIIKSLQSIYECTLEFEIYFSLSDLSLSNQNKMKQLEKIFLIDIGDYLRQDQLGFSGMEASISTALIFGKLL